MRLSRREQRDKAGGAKKHCDPQGAYMRATGRSPALSESHTKKQGLSGDKPVFFGSKGLFPVSGGRGRRG